MQTAQGLRSKSLIGSDDPYCNVSVKGKPESAFSTQVVYNSQNPSWNSTVLFTDFEDGDDIEFKVLDRNIMATDEVLGTVSARSNVFFPAGYEGSLSLGHSGTHHAYLEVNLHSVDLDTINVTHGAAAFQF